MRLTSGFHPSPNKPCYKNPAETISTYAFIPAEKTGGSYRIDGWAQITQGLQYGKYQVWYLTIGVSGATDAIFF